MALENGLQGEMGGGSYTYETLPGITAHQNAQEGQPLKAFA